MKWCIDLLLKKGNKGYHDNLWTIVNYLNDILRHCYNKSLFIIIDLKIGKVWRYQRGNQNP